MEGPPEREKSYAKDGYGKNRAEDDCFFVQYGIEVWKSQQKHGRDSESYYDDTVAGIVSLERVTIVTFRSHRHLHLYDREIALQKRDSRE